LRQKRMMRRLEEHQEVADHLQKYAQGCEAISLRIHSFRRPFAQKKNACEENPAQHHANKSHQCSHAWIVHDVP